MLDGEEASPVTAPVADLSNPILNGPYDSPSRHFEVGPKGPTGVIRDGRRPSESFIPIPPTRKGQRAADGLVQGTLEFEGTGERRERNDLVNDVRRDVDRWRRFDYQGVTPTSRKLLQYWADEHRENRVLFCQREAAETAIFLAEVAGRHGYTDWRRTVEVHNAEHNDGLPRLALKMATGSGKTVVMAMLIAWHTANKVASPRDGRFAKRFLIVTPGITIRDRLRVLQPNQAGNYFDLRDLVPPDLKGAVAQAQTVITNYHAFQLKDVKEIKGVAANTRKILRAGAKADPFTETPDMMVARVLRTFTGSSEPIVVLNDEAHHCYRDRPIQRVRVETNENLDLESARVWFKGLQAVRRRYPVKSIYDLSATPFYLGGSGYQEGYIFPWVVSDFSLMDAIESGIVKVPRLPVDDDATGDLVSYLRLWDLVGKNLPKGRARKDAPTAILPKELDGALRSLYGSYEKSFAHWESTLKELGEPPPVYIVVCSNTATSKLVYDWIAGDAPRSGNLPLFSNVMGGKPLTRPRTILVDSAQLESGETLSKDFRVAAAEEIAAFQADFRRRNPGSAEMDISDEDLLREVMNTVGKPGTLGGEIRCVVSVSMLTEGWDANTVTHILGVRAFGSQLLCEQVVGRGLRRRSYAVNDDGRFEPEYANVYGIPFAFIPSDRAVAETTPPPPAVQVESVPGREGLRITFPKLEGYRWEIPDDDLTFSLVGADEFVLGPSTVPTRTDVSGIVGTGERHAVDARNARAQEVAYELARLVLDTWFVDDEGGRRPWLFPRIIGFVREWISTCVRTEGGYTIGNLLAANAGAERQHEAAEAVYNAIAVQLGSRRPRLRPLLRRFDPIGDTGSVGFATRKPTVETVKSEVNLVTLDGSKSGNTWEHTLADILEINDDVAAYVKNDHLGFAIPYLHLGRSHDYLPDFLVRLRRRPNDVRRYLIIEVSGGRKSPGPTKAKAATARDQWCVAVNNHKGFGRWGYLEVVTMLDAESVVAEAIAALYDDRLVGDPDLLDYIDTERVSHAAS